MYLSDNDIKLLRYTLWEVEHEVSELFKEALGYDNSLLIRARTEDVYKKFLFWKYKTNEIKTTYTIYHECIGNYEARQMFCASGSKEIVSAYLYGIINGVLHHHEQC